MEINFKDFIKDIQKGAGKVKKSYKELIPAVAERESLKLAEKNRKKKMKQLVDQGTKKEFIKRHGERAWNESLEPGQIINKQVGKRKKIEKETKEKYKKFD